MRATRNPHLTISWHTRRRVWLVTTTPCRMSGRPRARVRRGVGVQYTLAWLDLALVITGHDHVGPDWKRGWR